MSTRADFLLASVPKESRIIEIGPSFNPIAPKSAGWNSHSLDHMTREGLSEKYSGHPSVDVSKIEAVDFVWTDGLVSDAVPKDQHGSFDVFLASHVIEHTPDLIAFFTAAANLVKADGRMILAVPDKRYCFDYFQQLTTTGHVLEAHLKQRSRHTGQRAFDHYAYAVTDGGAESWGVRQSHGLKLTHDLTFAFDSYDQFENHPVYQDLHAWHFVPASFELLLLELGRLGKVDWQIDRIETNLGWEFLVWLSRGAGARTAALSAEELDGRRMALLKRTLLETQAQIDWLIANEPELTGEQGGLSTWATPLRYDNAVAALMDSKAEGDRLREQVAAAEARLAAATQDVAAFKASTFWRVTSPLRAVLDRVRGR